MCPWSTALHVGWLGERMVNLDVHSSTGEQQQRAVDWVSVALAVVVGVHCPLLNELVQLHHHAVAAHLHDTQPGGQSQQHHVHSRALPHELSRGSRSVHTFTPPCVQHFSFHCSWTYPLFTELTTAGCFLSSLLLTVLFQKPERKKEREKTKKKEKSEYRSKLQ